MEEQMVLKAEELLKEVRCAIEDCFVATVTEKDNALFLRFVNGQTFELSVKEVV